MKHPFSFSDQIITELSEHEVDAVSGGASSTKPVATTYAIGEEGGIKPLFPPVVKQPETGGGATTYALGEEGGIGPAFPHW